jgi:hypothetical protein
MLISKEQIAEKDRLIEKLYGDVKDMHIKLERVTKERNEALEKFSESEKYWRSKVSKADNEHNALFEMNQQLKEDNSSVLI